jgi:GxxExxY protein
MPELLLADEVYAVVGAAMEVHYNLGTGFLEAVYQEALEVELAQRNIPLASQMPVSIHYKGRQLRKTYCADLICYNQIIVELKVVDRLTNIEAAQIINYLKATRFHVGMLINFGSRGKLEWKRYVI